MRVINADEAKEAFIGNRYGTKAIEYIIDSVPTVEAIPIKWLCDYAVIIAENNYEQAKFIFRLIENYKSELNEDKDKVAIDNLKWMKENWLKSKNAVEKENES